MKLDTMCAPLSIVNKKDVVKIGSNLLLIRQAIQDGYTQPGLDEVQVLRLILLGCLYMFVSDNSISSFLHTSETSEEAFERDFLDAYIGRPDLAVLIYKNDSIKQYYAEIKSVRSWESLLPYAFEVLDYSDQDLIGAWHDRRAGIITRKKQQCGVYYTPADIVKYMVHGCLDGLWRKGLSVEQCSYIDFSCGSGVFLLQILSSLMEQGKIRTSDQYASFVAHYLFGIDISRHAVECAKYAVLQNYIVTWKDTKHLCDLFRALEKNYIAFDATIIEDFFALHPDYPKTFHCIIGNPPYVGLAGEMSHPREGNLFIPFVYNLQKYSKKESVSSLVLPLSLTYNSQAAFRRLRSDIAEDPAEWQIENYDRSPDSLFGDDVKARACIVFRISAQQNRLKTTGLTRWTSPNRMILLSSRKPLADISDMSVVDYIPKLATAEETDAFTLILNQTQKSSCLSNIPTPQTSSYPVVIKGTAYNWICSYDHIPPAFGKDAVPYVSKDLKFIFERTEADQYCLLAMLNSRVAFWLWTVIGDGFHVTSRLISIIQRCRGCINGTNYAELTYLGREFSEALRHYPTTSVNRGKTIISYNHMPLLETVRKIDTTFAQALRLNPVFIDYLEKWYDRMVFCGRNKQDF